MNIKNLSWWKVCLILGILFVAFIILYGIGYVILDLAKEPQISIPTILAFSCLFIGIYLAVIYKLDKTWLDTVAFRRFLPETTKGILIGLLLFACSVGTMALLGCYHAGLPHLNTIKLTEQLALFFLVGCCEEVIFRGILFKIVEHRWNVFTALVVSSLSFGFIHIGNANATLWSSIAIVIEAGLLLGVAYQYSGTLWMPIGIHWSWNFVQGPILGFAVSGHVEQTPLFSPTIQGSDLITGGMFGAEASVITALFGLSFAIALFHRHRKHLRP